MLKLINPCRGLIAIIFLLLIKYSLPANAITVDCDSSLWSPSLFCTLHPDGNYQLPIESSETGKAFSARMLYTDPVSVPPQAWDPSTDLRCGDGTEPYMYVDEGTTATQNWVFFFQGGGACRPSDENSETNCAVKYLQETPELSSHLGQRSKNLFGILSPVPADNPFSGYNRIKPDKCSYDRFMGRNSAGAPLAVNPARGVFQAGYAIVERMLAVLDFSGGANYTNCSGAYCVADLFPQLCQPGAQKFVFTGNSGGAHGLIYNIDKLVTKLRLRPDCNDAGDQYFVVIDAQFMPILENECKYDPGGCDACAAGLGNSIYCHDVAGTDGINSWDDDYYAGTGPIEKSTLVQEYADWGIEDELDLSCLAAHAASNDQEKCRDRFHVLTNHVSTPFFVRESLADMNIEHINGGNGFFGLWRNGIGNLGWNVDNWDASNIYVLESQQAYAERVVDQANDVADALQNQHAHEPLPPMRAFLPACINHEGVAQNGTFANMEIEGVSYRQALWGFVNQPEQYAAKVWSEQHTPPRDCQTARVAGNICFPVKRYSGRAAAICL